MGPRRWFVLLALAAVFWMHGVQCLAGDVGAGAAAGEVVSTAHPAARHAASVAAPAVGASSATAPHRPVVSDGPAAPAHDGPHDGLPAHLPSVCLAVLSVALAALVAALLAAPAVRVVPPLWHRTDVRGFFASVRRPPDLVALCVQRT